MKEGRKKERKKKEQGGQYKRTQSLNLQQLTYHFGLLPFSSF
jgi:hypothetical protein